MQLFHIIIAAFFRPVDVGFGSLADLLPKFSLMSALEGKAVIRADRYLALF